MHEDFLVSNCKSFNYLSSGIFSLFQFLLLDICETNMSSWWINFILKLYHFPVGVSMHNEYFVNKGCTYLYVLILWQWKVTQFHLFKNSVKCIHKPSNESFLWIVWFGSFTFAITLIFNKMQIRKKCSEW